MKLLFDDAAADGNGKPTETPTPEGAAPPMSHIAVTGEKSEREIKLETELDNERARADEAENSRKKVETDFAALQDEHHRYKQTVEGQKPAKKFRLPTVLD